MSRVSTPAASSNPTAESAEAGSSADARRDSDTPSIEDSATAGSDDTPAHLGSASRVAPRLAASVRAVTVVARHFEREALEAGLSLPQYRLMLFVRRGPQRAAELAAQAAVRRPTLTALVDGLEKEGLLARRAVEGDRRGIRLELTQRGLEALDRTEAQLAAYLQRMIAGSDSERILDGVSELARAIERFYAAQVSSGS